MIKRILLFSLISFTFQHMVYSQQEQLLWPENAVEGKASGLDFEPSLTYYPASSNTTGSSVIIFPGGGYATLALDHEGLQIAKWMNSIGISAFVVKYRHGKLNPHPGPLSDAQRAIRTVRSKALEYKLDTGKIGILGFSAGGHLASTLGTHYDAGNKTSKDLIGQQSSKPNFMILIYPVITMKPPFAHTGSKQNLLGDNPDPKLVDYLSNETQINSATPPTFLVHTENDEVVPVENSMMFYNELKKAGVKAEMHLFQTGDKGTSTHGYGMAQNDQYLSIWPKLCENWMKNIKVIQ